MDFVVVVVGLVVVPVVVGFLGDVVVGSVVVFIPGSITVVVGLVIVFVVSSVVG